MNLKRLTAPLTAAAIIAGLASCQNDTPTIGESLVKGEVQIAIDSLTWDGGSHYIHRGNDSTLVECPKLTRTTEFDTSVDTRSTTNLIGRISVPEYGDLNCSFVSRLMCATKLAIPDSIPLEQVDSMHMILSVPRGQLTGDSLAPQQLRAFELTKRLPDDITNSFDATGYYDPAKPIGSKSYTLSALGMSDSIYSKQSYIHISIPMSKEMAVNTVKAYREHPDTFKWPQSFEEYFHGIYVEPSFGRGCVANIAATNFILFYNYDTTTSKTDSTGTTTVTVTNTVGTDGIFESSPIVLSSNNVVYKPSESIQALVDAGESILTTPGGYRVHLRFPGRELVDIFRSQSDHLSVVSNLTFSIPAEEIDNEYGLTPPPYLLMVKSSKLKEFLASNSLPDSKDSFYATYSSATKSYGFSSMRSYILDLIQNGVNDEDLDFTLIPADLTIESSSSSYSSSSTPTVTKCSPYIVKPTMCRLLIDKARTVFTYSSQLME